jgi:hypothetical protein
VIGYDAHQAQAQRDRADRAERAAMARELAAARKLVEAAPPAYLLRALAEWLDLDDEERGRADGEVQRDLRRLADALDAYDATVVPRPGDGRDFQGTVRPSERPAAPRTDPTEGAGKRQEDSGGSTR